MDLSVLAVSDQVNTTDPHAVRDQATQLNMIAGSLAFDVVFPGTYKLVAVFVMPAAIIVNPDSFSVVPFPVAGKGLSGQRSGCQ